MQSNRNVAPAFAASRRPRAGRTVVRFEFRGVPKAKAKERYWWLVIHRPEPEICLKNPGFEVDAVVIADLAAFTRLALGYLGLREALDRGLVAFDGDKSVDRPAVPVAQPAARAGAEGVPVRTGPVPCIGVASPIEHATSRLNQRRQ